MIHSSAPTRIVPPIAVGGRTSRSSPTPPSRRIAQPPVRTV